MEETVSRAPESAASQETYGAGAANQRLRHGQLRFFRTIAESVGVQGPTGGVVISAAVLASISGGGTALVQVVAAIAMGFVAYAFILFTRGFNSAGSVYGFTGAVVGPVFGFFSAFALMMVYINFAGGVYASTAAEGSPALTTLGIHVPWQVVALVVFALVTYFTYLDIKISATLILILEGLSMLLVVLACIIITLKGGYHGRALSAAPFLPNGVSFAVLGLGIVYSFSAFSGFEAAATLGEESANPQRLIPWAIGISLAVVAIYEIGVAAVITNAFPSVKALAGSTVPLVTVTDKYVAGWLGELINIGATVSSFGAALACAVGASRMLFALGRDGFGPSILKRTSVRTGSPVGALIFVGGVSLAWLLAFITESDPLTAVGIILTYGADLIIAAYILVVVAAIIFTIKTRMSRFKTVILLVGLAILAYVVKDTFIPFPAAPYNWDFFGAALTLLVGLALPFISPRLREGIRNSPLLRVGSRVLLGREPAGSIAP